jgi:methyltransferase (TIGR00027 family)
MMAATSRGIHRLEAARPWVFDDPLALVMVGPAWPEVRAQMAASFGEDLLRASAAMLLVRSRFAEERLDAGPFAQYVLLGAGLDAFAWRRPDKLAAGLRLFEVDHPDSQAWKRARVEELGLPLHANHVFAPVDFEAETFAAGLDRVGFDWSAPTFFSWLGVVPYLTVDAVAATLQTLAKAGPGSEIVLSYVVPRSEMCETGLRFHDVLIGLLDSVGEPLQTLLGAAGVEALVERCGLTVVEHPDRATVGARYFAGRTDGLGAISFEMSLAARVPGAP